MAVKIRLARRGRRKQPFYHIVIADARAPRDGKFIEKIGSYNPMTKPATIDLDRDKAYDWLTKGAQPTETMRAILKFKGVYYKKHLMRGVSKGALTEDAADKMYQEWIEAKEAKIASRVEETRKEQEAFWKMVSGEIKPAKKVANPENAEAFREGEETADANAPAEVEASAEATAPVEEKAAEEVAPVAEKTEEKAAETEAPKKEEAAEAVAEVKTNEKEETPAAEEAAPVADAKEASGEEE